MLIAEVRKNHYLEGGDAEVISIVVKLKDFMIVKTKKLGSRTKKCSNKRGG